MSKKWLVQALILSGLFDIALIAIFFYFLVQDNAFLFTFLPSNETECEAISFNPELESLSFEQLRELLLDVKMLEKGYRVRDLALGVLVSDHHLDLIRAVGRPFSQSRLTFGETQLSVFPGLNHEDFQNIFQFTQRERWPLTSKGLFYEIEKGGMESVDTDLVIFFCRCPEFIAFETLFVREHFPIQKGTLLKMAIEGGWERLEHYFKSQEKKSDFSDRMRQALLLDYIEGGSKTAAYLLLLIDYSFANTELDDRGVSQLIDLLIDNTPEVLTFLETISTSQRSEQVCQKASQSLTNFLDLSEEEISGRYFPRPGIGELRPKFRDKPPMSVSPQVHVIQLGESLWLIARKYQLSVEALMEYNQLHSTVIQPGKTLKIPSP